MSLANPSTVVMGVMREHSLIVGRHTMGGIRNLQADIALITITSKVPGTQAEARGQNKHFTPSTRTTKENKKNNSRVTTSIRGMVRVNTRGAEGSLCH